MTPWRAKADNISWKRKADVKVAVTDSDAVNARILKLATDLGNTVLAKKAASDLQTCVHYWIREAGWYADNIAGSKRRRRRAFPSQPYSTRSCKCWRHTTSGCRPVGLYWTSLTSLCSSRLCSKKRTRAKRTPTRSRRRTRMGRRRRLDIASSGSHGHGASGGLVHVTRASVYTSAVA